MAAKPWVVYEFYSWSREEMVYNLINDEYDYEDETVAREYLRDERGFVVDFPSREAAGKMQDQLYAEGR